MGSSDNTFLTAADGLDISLLPLAAHCLRSEGTCTVKSTRTHTQARHTLTRSTHTHTLDTLSHTHSLTHSTHSHTRHCSSPPTPIRLHHLKMSPELSAAFQHRATTDTDIKISAMLGHTHTHTHRHTHTIHTDTHTCSNCLHTHGNIWHIHMETHIPGCVCMLLKVISLSVYQCLSVICTGRVFIPPPHHLSALITISFDMFLIVFLI